ncbi:MAG: phosphate ABC transporter permease PstA [Microcoleus anatoxicus]|uniref:phosphate ABC transporter permease PstA n=1 Tax=Microcoleus anatoxicus TaxID=2705319 RepID=UPI003673079F
MNQAQKTPTILDAEIYNPLSLGRNFFSRGMTVIAFALTALALLPLFAILYKILGEGLTHLSWDVLVSLPAPVGVEDQPNGFANAILGTALMVGIATLFSVPIGVMTGIFLSEFGRENKGMANAIRFITVILSSVPSIVVGVFTYALIVVTTKVFSGLAGGIALGIIMLPVVALTTEQALKLVPTSYRLASGGLGAGRFQTIFRIIIPSALPTITTGVLLAASRAAGETAPLIVTALSSQFWPPLIEKLGEITQSPLGAETLSKIQEIPGTILTPTPSMSVLIYSYASSPYKEQNELAWTAASVLLGMVLIASVASRAVTRKRLQNR